MLPFGIGAGEVILIMVVVLLVMGPGKLPEIARAMGRGVRVLRRAGQELKDAIDVEDEVARIRSWEMPDPVSETAEVESIEGDAHDVGGYHDEHGRFYPDESTAAQNPDGPATVTGPVKRDEGTVVPVATHHLSDDEAMTESIVDAPESDTGGQAVDPAGQKKDSEG